MITRVATVADLIAHVCLKNPPLAQSAYRLMLAEVLDGRVVAAVASLAGTAATQRAHVVALGGVSVPDLPGPGTCWFSVLPGGLSREMVPAALVMRRVLRATAPAFVDGLAAYVRIDNAHGARLARALGFHRTGRSVGGLEQWTYAPDAKWASEGAKEASNGGRADRQDGTAAAGSGATGAGHASGAAG